MRCFLKASPKCFEDENPSLYFEKTLLGKIRISREEDRVWKASILLE